MAEAIQEICAVLSGLAALAYLVEKVIEKIRLRLPPESPFHAHPDMAQRLTLNQEIDDTRTNIADLESSTTLAMPPLTTNVYRVWTQLPHLTEFVKVGWSWPAFLFGAFWALTKRMPLHAGAMFLVGVVEGYAMAAMKLSKVDAQISFFLTSLLLGLLFGAYGNAWREWQLAKRGFLLRDTTLRIHPVYGPVVAGLRVTWTNKRLRAACVGAILVVSIATGLYFMLRPSAIDRMAAEAEVQLIRHCDKATITAHAIPHGSETSAWFEWGETPELGRATIKQRFTEENDFYQHLMGLKENTTYYYKAVLVNTYGRTDTRGYARSRRPNAASESALISGGRDSGEIPGTQYRLLQAEIKRIKIEYANY
ncbi:MAG: DUF2628 domain-containing protein [Deltaproteobacteria bacterium]